MTTPSPKIRWAVFFLIALLALAVRLPQLGERPMHTDEAINAYRTGELLAGENFRYDPKDRHGPALFVLAGPVVKICGAKNFSELTETQLRLTPVIVGSGMILLFGAAVEMFGFSACLVAALLFVFAPLPVYYSRYFIHETLFVAATLGLILSAWRAGTPASGMARTAGVSASGCSGDTLKRELQLAGSETGVPWSAALAGFCAALMLACKETAVIHFFALGVALVVHRFGTPASGPARTGTLHQLAGSETGVPSAKIIFTALAVFIFTVVLLFTWFGQHWAGLTDLFRAIPHLAARAGGEGHEKPFGYYFHLLDPLFVLSLLAVAGIYAAICDAVGGTRKVGLPLVIYALAVSLIYSAIPYKTPWLALNLWLPFALLCGLGTGSILELINNPNGRWGAGIAVAFLLATLGAQTKEFVFDKPADEKNPYAYAHTGEDLLRLPGRLDELARENKTANPRIAVVATDAWPLPWYLRKFSTVGYWQPGQETGDADFFITTSDPPTNLTERLKNFRPEFFGARPEVLLMLWSPMNLEKRHEP